MFGNKKGLADRVKDSLTDYLDKKFDEYRGLIAEDLAKGLASLAGLVAIWTIAILCFLFVSITLALLLGWIFSFWLAQFGYILSFLTMSFIILGTAYFLLKNKEAYIEDPVYKIMAETLRSPYAPNVELVDKSSELSTNNYSNEEEDDADDQEEDLLSKD